MFPNLLFLQTFTKDCRLNTTVIQYERANTGMECILECVLKNESCRSINFRKNTNYDNNCEFLKDVDSEVPKDLLLKNESFDYYILLEPKRVSIYYDSVFLHTIRVLYIYLTISRRRRGLC